MKILAIALILSFLKLCHKAETIMEQPSTESMKPTIFPKMSHGKVWIDSLSFDGTTGSTALGDASETYEPR